MSDLQVVLPYKEVVELLEASRRVEALTSELSYLRKEHDALRGQFVELMERFRELKDFVID